MINWDQYFINIMKAASLRSKDPKTKVGAVIVGQDNRIIGVGYNGFPQGLADTDERWCNSKYDYVVHAEMNAILNANSSVKGCRLYVPFWPCKDCAKFIAAAGLTEVIVLSDYYKGSVAEEIFNECNITVRQVYDL